MDTAEKPVKPLTELIDESILCTLLSRIAVQDTGYWILFESALPRLLDELNARLISIK